MIGPIALSLIRERRPAGGIPVSITIPAVHARSFEREAVEKGIPVSLHTGCLSVGFTQQDIVLSHVKMGLIACEESVSSPTRRIN